MSPKINATAVINPDALDRLDRIARSVRASRASAFGALIPDSDAGIGFLLSRLASLGIGRPADLEPPGIADALRDIFGRAVYDLAREADFVTLPLDTLSAAERLDWFADWQSAASNPNATHAVARFPSAEQLVRDSVSTDLANAIAGRLTLVPRGAGGSVCLRCSPVFWGTEWATMPDGSHSLPAGTYRGPIAGSMVEPIAPASLDAIVGGA